MNGLELHDILLTFPEGARRRTILDIPSCAVAPGECVALAGASGSGKSTFLNLISGLILPDRGTVRWNGFAPAGLPEHGRDVWRGRHVGLVFQDFRLFPELEALENVLLPVTFHSWRIPEGLRRRGLALLERMNIPPFHKARLLSRGEKQRVAIARAVLQEPEILLADEPTASLDAANAAEVTELLLDHARKLGSTLVIVSHDEEVWSRMDRVLHLRRGLLHGAAETAFPGNELPRGAR